MTLYIRFLKWVVAKTTDYYLAHKPRRGKSWMDRVREYEPTNR